MMEREGCSHVVFSCCPRRCRAQRQRTNKQVETFHGGWAESRHPSGSVLTQFNHRQNKCAERGLGAGMGAGLRGQPAPSRECKPSLDVHFLEPRSTSKRKTAPGYPGVKSLQLRCELPLLGWGGQEGTVPAQGQRVGTLGEALLTSKRGGEVGPGSQRPCQPCCVAGDMAATCRGPSERP